MQFNTTIFLDGGMVLPNFMSLKSDPSNGQKYIQVYTSTRKVVSFPDYMIKVTSKVNLLTPFDY